MQSSTEHGVLFCSVCCLQCPFGILRMPVHSKRSTNHLLPSSSMSRTEHKGSIRPLPASSPLSSLSGKWWVRTHPSSRHGGGASFERRSVKTTRVTMHSPGSTSNDTSGHRRAHRHRTRQASALGRGIVALGPDRAWRRRRIHSVALRVEPLLHRSSSAWRSKYPRTALRPTASFRA